MTSYVCHVWTFSISTVIYAGSIILLIVGGILIVKPALATANYKATKCIVNSYNYAEDKECQYSVPHNNGRIRSGRTFDSSFPCIQIYVQVNLANSSAKFSSNRIMLYDSDEELLEKCCDCSYHYCEGPFEKNRDKVREFEYKYARQSNEFECYYNSGEANDKVLLRVRFSITTAVILLVVPIIVALLSFIVVIYSFKKMKETKPR